MTAWFLLALCCALFWSAADAFSKAALSRQGPLRVLWARWAFSLPLLALGGALFAEPGWDGMFWAVVLVSAPLEFAAGILYLRSLKIAPMSLTLPLLAWTPVFTTVFSFIALGERPSFGGAGGILLVVAGSYLLARGRGKGLLDPFRALAGNRGSRMMFAVALIYSLTSALGKIGVLHSSPTLFALVYSLVLVLVITAVLAVREGKGAFAGLLSDRLLLGAGLAAGMMVLLHFSALELTQVAYMISVKRTSLIFSVLLGRLVFGERQTPWRFAGASVMVGGVLLLAFQE